MIETRRHLLNRNNIFRFFLIYIVFGLFILSLFVQTSLGGVPTPDPTVTIASPTATQTLNPTDIINQTNWQNIADYYKNESQYYQNIYENESVNTSNKNIIEIKNNINIINQNINQLNKDIKNGGTNLEINFYLGLIIEISLISLFAIGVYIKRNVPKNRK